MQQKYDVLITGKGGHASMPHTANNPVLILAGWISLISQIPAYSFAPSNEVGVDFEKIEAGDKGNIIPDTVKAKINLKAETEELLASLEEKVLATSHSYIHAYEGNVVFSKAV
jgi:hippurate hydrolase